MMYFRGSSWQREKEEKLLKDDKIISMDGLQSKAKI